MDWTAAVDIYCERTGPGFWSEPINAVTNVAFVLAGLWAAARARAAGRLDGPLALLCALTVMIGIGSFLFHTVAQRWAGLLDVLPILGFVIAYLCISGNRLFGMGWALAIPAGLAALTLALPVALIPAALGLGSFNGTESYFPALALLAAASILLRARGLPGSGEIALAALLFLASMTARALDMAVCADIATGTHFLWHVLNAAVLATLLMTLILHGRAPERTSGA